MAPACPWAAISRFLAPIHSGRLDTHRASIWNLLRRTIPVCGVLLFGSAPGRAQSPATAPAPRLSVPVVHANAVTSLTPWGAAALGDRSFLLSVGADLDRSVRLWDQQQQRLLAELSLDQSPIAAALPVIGDASVIVLSRDGALARWWPSSDSVLHLEGADRCEQSEATPRLAVSSAWIVVACGAEVQMRQLRSRTGRPETIWITLPEPVSALSLAEDDRSVAVGGASGGLWLVATPDLSRSSAPLRAVGRHAGAVTSLLLSPDGEWLTTGSADHSIRSWSLRDGSSIRIGGHGAPVVAMFYGLDGTLLSVSADRQVREWSQSGQLLHEVALRGAPLTAATFDARTGWLATGHDDGGMRLWDATGGFRSLGAMGQRVQMARDVAIMAKDQGSWTVATALDDGALVSWSLLTGAPELSASFPGAGGGETRQRLAAAGSVLAVLSNLGALRVLDVRSNVGRLLIAPVDSALTHQGAGVVSLAEGAQVLTASTNGAALLWSTGDGSLRRVADPLRDTAADETRPAAPVTAIAANASGDLIVRGLSDGRVRVLDLKRDSIGRTIGSGGRGVSAVAVSRSGNLFAISTADGAVSMHERGSDRELASWRHGARIQKVVILERAETPAVLVADDRGGLCLYRARADTCEKFTSETPVIPSPSNVSALALTDDEQVAVTSGGDAWIRVWRIADRRLAYARVAFDSSAWLVVDPSGRFDGAPDAIRRLNFVEGLTVIGLDRLIERDFAPGLARQALASNSASHRLSAGRPQAPSLEARVVAGDSSSRLLVVRPAGSSEVRMQHNGVMLPSLRSRALCPGDATCFVGVLGGDANVFEATAVGSDGSTSEPSRLLVQGAAVAPDRGRTLHILAAGIDRYPAPDQLDKATADARSLALALARRGMPLYARVVVDTLFDGAATHDGIASGFARASALGPDDVFVFIFVGHGLVVGQEGFSLASWVDGLPLAGRLGARAGLVSAAQLREWLVSVPALHKVALLDACHSGAGTIAIGIDSPDGGRIESGAADAARLSWTRLGSAGGIFVVGSAGSDQYAFEGPATERNGVFATAVLDALELEDDVPSPWTIRSLIAATEARLPVVRRRLQVRYQEPVIWTLGRDFTLVAR